MALMRCVIPVVIACLSVAAAASTPGLVPVAQGPALVAQGVSPAPAVPLVSTAWVPDEVALQSARAACETPAEGLSRCVIEQLGKGAPADALAFTRRFHEFSNGELAFVRALRAAGRVSVAYVTYPFRTNETSGCLLVNGSPGAIDVDDRRHLPLRHLARDPTYTLLKARYTDVTVWPGDRVSPAEPVAAAVAGGGQRFTVSYRLRAGCGTCEEIGIARFAFDFDAEGAYKGAALVSVSDRVPRATTIMVPIGPAARAPGRTLHLQVGETFTIMLDANRSAGHGWRLARDLDSSIVTLVDEASRTTRGTRVGTSGREVWVFKAAGAGVSELAFEYGRPGSKASRTAAYTIVVR